jgi:hypothetical protein
MDGFGIWLGSLIDFVIQVERDHSGREERFGWLVCFKRDMMLRESNIRRIKGEYICVEVDKEETDQRLPSSIDRTYLLNILKHHVSMPIKRLNSSQQLLIIPQTNQDLRLIPDGLL